MEVAIKEDAGVETSEGSGGKIYSLDDVCNDVSIIGNDAAERDECVVNVQQSC